MKTKSLPAILFIGLAVLITSCTRPARSVTIFHAGSLSLPMKKIKAEFEKKNPGVTILLESSGSRAAARKISELKKPCDIMASADYRVIYNLLMSEYTSFTIRFATNEMALVHTKKSKYAGTINADNWYKILLRKDVNYGHSDPESDPCGYRSQLVCQLAEKYYKEPGLYKRLSDGCPQKNIRPKETDLLALLEVGALDYIFLYRSVAVQRGLPFLALPREINLGDARLNPFYNKTHISLRGKKPGIRITVHGEAMVYGVTLVKKPVNKKDALAFLKFMLGNEGLSIIKGMGQGPLTPPVSAEINKVPAALRPLVKGI